MALTCSLRLSPALWLLQDLSGSYWLSVAPIGSLPFSFWLSVALCDSHSGSHWLSLPLSGILWPSPAYYCSLILLKYSPCSALTALAWLSGPLLGSQRRCHADALYPGLGMGEELRDSKVENKHYQFSLSARIEKSTVNFECYNFFNLLM